METRKIIATNRRAYHDYSIEETMEAGMVLLGTEIKSLRAGKVSLAQSYAKPEKGELWLLNAHIAPYESGNRYNHDPARPRKLLMHHKEIRELASKVMEKRFAIVPLRVYLKKGRAKVELGLGKGKRLYDKRESIARREANRDIERTLKMRHTKS